jgi:serine/threonine protein kinase
LRRYTKVAAKTFIGTPIFMSPEMFRQVPYGHKADIWALGRGLHSLTSKLNLRTFGTHRSR